jgi:ribonucleotide reductase beta subunit family protein with ferritin-like domain
MNTSLFSVFNFVNEMELPLSSPTKSRSAINSPLMKANVTKFDDIEPIDNFVEPILQENPTRFSLFPIMKPKLFQKYKNHVSVFWTPEEIDLARDMADWEKLNDDERYFIKNVLGFFAGSDGIVMENLSNNFANEVQIPEARFFYAAQNMIESIHSESYSLLIDTYIQDNDEKDEKSQEKAKNLKLMFCLSTNELIADDGHHSLRMIT